jgi:hypothetical protein
VFSVPLWLKCIFNHHSSPPVKQHDEIITTENTEFLNKGITQAVIAAAISVRKNLGSGLLKSVYETHQFQPNCSKTASSASLMTQLCVLGALCG